MGIYVTLTKLSRISLNSLGTSVFIYFAQPFYCAMCRQAASLALQSSNGDVESRKLPIQCRICTLELLGSLDEFLLGIYLCCNNLLSGIVLL